MFSGISVWILTKVYFNYEKQDQRKKTKSKKFCAILKNKNFPRQKYEIEKKLRKDAEMKRFSIKQQ